MRLAVDQYLGIVVDTARIGNAQHQPGARFENAPAAGRFTQWLDDEMPAGAEAKAEQPGLVNAPVACLDHRFAGHHEFFRRQHQAALDHLLAGFASLAGLAFRNQHINLFAVTQFDDRSDQCLFARRAVGDAGLHLVLALAAVADLAFDQAQRYEQQ